MDAMVLATQQYLNKNYGGKSGYNTIAEDGATGWSTIYALTRALQIELGLSAPANNFGNASVAAFTQKYPSGIKEQSAGAEEASKVYAIIQGALWCKGYSTGANKITEHFYSGTGSAIKKLKKDAGFENPDTTVTLNIMKALLSMDQFRVIYSQGGTSTIQSIQQQINRKYEKTIGIIPCDGLYGRNMNKALIKVLQVIEGLTPDGVFGNQTKAKCPVLPDTVGKLSGTTVETATFLVKYALCCNGYEAGVTTSDWTTAVETAVKDFQRDLNLDVTGVVNIDTWMSLLLSKGNPDRACTACDTRFEITSKRADELKRKGYSIVGRYLTGGNFKGLRDNEPQQILNKGLNFFPIFQESGTNIAYFTEDRGKTDADKAVRAARKFKIPEGTVIYFAVDLDATDPQISKYIEPYFKSLSENIDTAYKVGIYGTRNVCAQICAKGYAATCFVSDMSTGYSGNMGFKIPSNWNFDQYAEIKMDAASDGAWAIDKDAYSGKFEPVKELETYVYHQPKKTNVPEHPTISEILPLIETLEDLYVDWYTPLFLAAPNTVPYLSAQVLAAGITNFLRSIAYNDIKWKLTLSSADEDFVDYVRDHNLELYNRLLPYMTGAEEDKPEALISDEHGGIIDLKHLAATAEGYFTASIAPDAWYGWAADLATAIMDTEGIVAEYDSYQRAADIVIGSSEHRFSFEDICSDADAIKVAKLIQESSSTTHPFSDALRSYFTTYVGNRYCYLLEDINCKPNISAIREKIAEDMRVSSATLALTVASTLSEIKDSILHQESIDFKEMLERLPSSPAFSASCSSFANYIYCELE